MMTNAVLTELQKVGYNPSSVEVTAAIGCAIPMMWQAGVTVELPALVTTVEDILFASDRYFNAVAGINPISDSQH